MPLHYWIVKLTMILFPKLFWRYYREYKRVEWEWQFDKNKKEMEYGRTK